MNDHDPDLEIVRRAVDVLIEHFDSVQVFVSRCDGLEDGTVGICLGRGNYHARYGQVREWVTKEDEGTRKSVCGD